MPTSLPLRLVTSAPVTRFSSRKSTASMMSVSADKVVTNFSM
jgi:hypothetical protein